MKPSFQSRPENGKKSGIFCRIFTACGCKIVNATMLGYDVLR